MREEVPQGVLVLLCEYYDIDIQVQHRDSQIFLFPEHITAIYS